VLTYRPAPAQFRLKHAPNDTRQQLRRTASKVVRVLRIKSQQTLLE
jgi:hypothetical protein